MLVLLGIVCSQSKSYAVLTNATLPTDALLRVETVTGQVVWKKTNAVDHLEPLVEDKRRVNQVWRSWKIAWDKVLAQLPKPPEKESQEIAIKTEMEVSPPEEDTKFEESVPPQQAGEIRVSLSPRSSDCSELKE